MPRGTVGEEEGGEGGLLLEINKCMNSLDRTGTDQQETQAFDVSDCFLGLDAQEGQTRAAARLRGNGPNVWWVLLHDLSFPARRGGGRRGRRQRRLRLSRISLSPSLPLSDDEGGYTSMAVSDGPAGGRGDCFAAHAHLVLSRPIYHQSFTQGPRT